MRPLRLAYCLDAAAAVFAILGFSGLIWSAHALDDFTSTWLAPRFVDVYLTTYLLYYALQVPWLLHLAPLRGRRTAASLFVYFGVVEALALCLMVANYAGYRPDGGSWALVLMPCVAICVYLARGRAQHARLSGDQPFGLKEAKPINHESLGQMSPAGLPSPEVLHICVSEGGWRPVALRVLAGVNAFVLAVAVITMALLLGGSAYQASGYRSYPPRGTFVTLTYPGGERQDVMVWCTGARNASLPTFVLDIGGGGHSSSDLYGMQFALNDAGYRVCTYDYPGCGWSDPGVNATQPMILDLILEAIAEPPPYFLLGTMDGGPDRIYQYALAHPQNVRALVVIDYSPGPPEFLLYQMVRNYTDEEAQTYASQQLTGRYQLGNLIRGVAVQWGLMPLFAPPTPGWVPADLQGEKLFLNLYNEKQWQTQTVYLWEQVNNIASVFELDSWGADPGLSPSIPVFWLQNNVNFTQQCEQQSLDATTCAQNIAMSQITYGYIVAATSRTPGSRLIEYPNASGLLSQGEYLPWAVAQILDCVGNLTIAADSV